MRDDIKTPQEMAEQRWALRFRAAHAVDDGNIEEARAHSDLADELEERIGAANTLTIDLDAPASEIVALLRGRGVAVVEETAELRGLLSTGQPVVRPPWPKLWVQMMGDVMARMEHWADSEQGKNWTPMEGE